MKTRNILLGLFVMAILTSTGCMSRLAKEGLGVATGAKGAFSEAPSMGPKGATPLRSYQDFQVGKITDDFGGRTPSLLLATLPGEIRKELKEKEIPTGQAGRTIIIQGRVFYYEKAGMMGQVFGPLEESVAEIQLVDKDTGRVVGTAVCVGRSTTTSNQGVEKKAEGLAKGIVDWIASRYTTEK